MYYYIFSVQTLRFQTELVLIIYEYLQKKLIMKERREERGREGGEEGWDRRGVKEQNNLGKAVKVTTSPL